MGRAALVLGAALALAACGADGGEGALRPGRVAAAEEGALHLVLGGRTLVLGTPSGDVVVRGVEGDTARVRFVREARGATHRSAAERLARVHVDHAQDAYLVQVIADTDGLEGASVRLEAEVPHRTALVVQARRGAVRLERVEGDVLVEGGEGTVEAGGLAGERVQVTVRRGGIRARFAALPPGADVRLLAERGDVEVAVPSEGSVVVMAGTRAGELVFEGLAAEEESEGVLGRRRLRARLGEGGARLRAEADTGTVRVRAVP